MKELINRCLACSVQINEHKTYYQTAKQYLEELNTYSPVLEDIDSDVLQEIYNRDVLVEVFCYPATPIGSYRVYHYDYDLAIQEMLNILNSTNK